MAGCLPQGPAAAEDKIYMRILVLIVCLLGISLGGFTQADPNWFILQRVSFDENTGETTGFGMPKPVFPSIILEKDGKEITLDGYIYPLEGQKASKHFVLSSLPISQCFFCGGGGPETVVEIFAKEDIDYQEERVKLKGILRVNAHDPMGMLYVLENAEQVVLD